MEELKHNVSAGKDGRKTSILCRVCMDKIEVKKGGDGGQEWIK